MTAGGEYNKHRCTEYHEIEQRYEEGLLNHQEMLDQLAEHYAMCRECKTGEVQS